MFIDVMSKLHLLILIAIVTGFRPALAQSKLDGVYQGIEEIVWTDSLGLSHNVFLSGDSSKWYHESHLAIRADSIFIGQSPLHIVNGKKLYSASTGGFYYYAGTILKTDSSIITKISLTSCGYCPQPVTSTIDEKTGEETLIKVDQIKKVLTYILIKTKNGLVLNNVHYRRLSPREIKKFPYL
jgi:hypothetical protein